VLLPGNVDRGRLDDRDLAGEQGHPAERAEGILGVVEDAQEEHDVVGPHVVGRHGHEIGDQLLDAAVQDPMGGVEPRLARQGTGVPETRYPLVSKGAAALSDASAVQRSQAVQVQAPDVVVHREHPPRAALLGVKGIEAVPRADVENGLAGERGQLPGFELQGVLAGGLAAGGDDAFPEIDGVPPAPDPVHELLLLALLHLLLRRLSWRGSRGSFYHAPAVRGTGEGSGYVWEFENAPLQTETSGVTLTVTLEKRAPRWSYS
jgi:hypothetical protein